MANPLFIITVGEKYLELRTDLPPVDQCWSLFLTTGWNAEYRITQEQFGAALTRSWCTVSAYENRRLVGFGRVVGDGVLYAMIHDMIVHPDYQGRGVGGRILDMLVQRCVEARIGAIQLFSSKGNRSFYEKRGFVARPDDKPGMEYRPAR